MLKSSGRLNKITTAALAALCAFAAMPATVAAGTADTPASPPVFDLADFGADLYAQRCSNCHAIDPAAKASIAPPLHDIIGRRAGSAAGYHYSVKLAGSDLVWDAAALDEWLETSTIATPDIRFRHVGIKDAIERKALVAYIEKANAR